MLFHAMRQLVEAPPEDVASGVYFGSVHKRLFEAIPDLESRWRGIVGDSWRDASYTDLQFNSVGLVKAGWIHKARRRWYVTGLGRHALTEHPDTASFYAELNRVYKYWEVNRSRFDNAVAMVEALPEGRWTSVTDVASEAGIDAAPLIGFLLGSRPDGLHRLLSDDGTRRARPISPKPNARNGSDCSPRTASWTTTAGPTDSTGCPPARSP
jgi:5-methylcytosine-specific restriction protein B